MMCKISLKKCVVDIEAGKTILTKSDELSELFDCLVSTAVATHYLAQLLQ